MRLNSADIVNYRSIANIHIGFNPTCRILVGLNESGKSSLLQCLALLDPEQKPSPTDARLPSRSETNSALPSFVEFNFEAESEDAHTVVENLVSRFMFDASKEKIIDANGERLTLLEYVATVFVTYRVNIRDNVRTFIYWDEDREISFPTRLAVLTAPIPSSALPTLPPRNPASPEVPAGAICLLEQIPQEFASSVKDFDPEELAEIVFKSLSAFSLPKCVFWSYSEQNLLPERVPAKQFFTNPNSFRPLKNMFELAKIDAQTCANLIGNYYGMSNLLSRVSNAANDYIASAWKDYSGVTITLSPDGDSIVASIKDRHNFFPMTARSEGFKRFITFLLLLGAEAKTAQLSGAIILIDEPDLGLHPSASRHLLHELKKISDKNIVVFSTHSIHMIDKDAIQRHLIVKKEEETTLIEDANEESLVGEEVLHTALGFDTFEILPKSNIVFEGRRDKLLFEASKGVKEFTNLHKELLEFGIAFARGVKDFPRIWPILDLACRKYILISANDSVAVQEQQKFNGQGEWFRYSELCNDDNIITSEDFISPLGIKRAADYLSKKHNLPKITLLGSDKIGPVLPLIARWISECGGKPSLLTDFKEQLFDNISGVEIQPSYGRFLGALCEKVKSSNTLE